MTWASNLRPASFRGVPFTVTEAEAELARRIAVHSYPFRDTVWPEDLGGGGTTWDVTGRIVGDNVIALRDRMRNAAQQPGVGELVHPTFGSQQVACTSFRTRELWDHGRVIELAFRFVKAADREPGLVTRSTGGGLSALADAAGLAAKGDFLSGLSEAYSTGRTAVAEVVGTANGYVQQAQGVLGDATAVVHQIGEFVPGVNKAWDRYTAGAARALSIAGTTSSQIIDRASQAQQALGRVGATVTSLAGLL